ncbi:DUF3617 domain-containing protein [Kangiella sediminilitoris]|uniref:DUF3617 family protein n=1 Tax=Kangiella sediminilitoris TaxID=1144748 RepID=A0A1B3BC41_9GAMM|nr:DUF3617 family protein [Kangiella sediminilitoris]AOE50371.1 hypothetical protein KS2013_1661 [Kangiella sediminilitoris]
MKTQIFSGLIALTVSFSALSEGLEINPGLWETTMTRTNPISGDNVTQTTKECIKEKTIDPSDLVQEMEGCKLTHNDLVGNTLDFAMECSSEGVTSSISGNYEANDNEGEGSMDIAMNMMGQVMEMNMSWTSKRLGECPNLEG